MSTERTQTIAPAVASGIRSLGLVFGTAPALTGNSVLVLANAPTVLANAPSKLTPVERVKQLQYYR